MRWILALIIAAAAAFLLYQHFTEKLLFEPFANRDLTDWDSLMAFTKGELPENEADGNMVYPDEDYYEEESDLWEDESDWWEEDTDWWEEESDWWEDESDWWEYDEGLWEEDESQPETGVDAGGNPAQKGVSILDLFDNRPIGQDGAAGMN